MDHITPTDACASIRERLTTSIRFNGSVAVEIDKNVNKESGHVPRLLPRHFNRRKVGEKINPTVGP